MPDKVFYIKSSTGKYDFVQEAHCKHCAFYGVKPVRNDKVARGVSYCYSRFKFTNKESMSCNEFSPNSRFVLAKQYVQLNIFDYATESFSEVSTVRD